MIAGQSYSPAPPASAGFLVSVADTSRRAATFGSARSFAVGKSEFDAGAFGPNADGAYGNSGRAPLRLPGRNQTDLALSKNFYPLTGKRLQFRADAFNLLNTPQFGFPNANIGSPTAGRITTTIADNRSLQFALKLDW